MKNIFGLIVFLILIFSSIAILGCTTNSPNPTENPTISNQPTTIPTPTPTKEINPSDEKPPIPPE